MKAILMSIQPKWLVKILNGEKTIETRKTMPKNIKLPCDVYLVCSKAKPYLYTYSRIKEKSDWEWEQVFFVSKEKNVVAEKLNGKVVCKFTLNKTEDCCDMNLYELLEKAVLTIDELLDYAKSHSIEPKMLYAYHIDNLVIFNKPKEIGEFYKMDYDKGALELINWYKDNNQLDNYNKFVLTKAPQSWQYCWVKGE